jgi:hypothetical protein
VSGRAERLQRLLAIRRLNEELGRRGLQLALASVAEVDGALARQKMAQLESNLAARAALNAGDRREWLLADAQSEVAGWNRGRLNTLLQARASDVPPAMAKFLESRLEHEQVKQLIEDAQRVAQTEEDRRAQAAADDWFLSKRMRPHE